MLKVHSFRMRKRFTVGVVFLCTAFVSSFSQAQPGQNPNSLPPGLQKKVEEGKPLPPGWERKLEIGGYLDRDIYRRADVLYRDADIWGRREHCGLVRDRYCHRNDGGYPANLRPGSGTALQRLHGGGSSGRI